MRTPWAACSAKAKRPETEARELAAINHNRAYHCFVCGWWHLTKSLARPSRKARRVRKDYQTWLEAAMRAETYRQTRESAAVDDWQLSA